MGAAARTMLAAAAAADWSVDPASCRTENGHVIHDATGRRLSYGELAERAAALAPPLDVATKGPDDFRIVGKPVKRLDTPAKTDGTAVFGLDVSVPGMLTAVLERPPVFGARRKSVDADAAKAVPGVRHVVEIGRSWRSAAAWPWWPTGSGRRTGAAAR
jgi:CO/xanthine dehydrogenase Mo-binding subunit